MQKKHHQTQGNSPTGTRSRSLTLLSRRVGLGILPTKSQRQSPCFLTSPPLDHATFAPHFEPARLLLNIGFFPMEIRCAPAPHKTYSAAPTRSCDAHAQSHCRDASSALLTRPPFLRSSPPCIAASLVCIQHLFIRKILLSCTRGSRGASSAVLDSKSSRMVAHRYRSLGSDPVPRVRLA